MKTLDQIEPRTLLNATNTPGDATNTYIISAPGSYYLTGNLVGDSGKHGISIQASDVTLDLNGFALVNTTPGVGTVRGVDVPAEQKNICIRNGTVRLWNGGGVRAETVRNALVEKLRVSDCTGAVGIYVGLGSLVKDCVANANGIGIQTSDRCQVMSCISTENTGNGFQSTSYVTIVDGTSSRNGGHGIKVEDHCSILRCSATWNDIDGISMNLGCTTTGCTGSRNGGNGILGSESSISACTANSNGLAGFYATRCSVANSNAHRNATFGIYCELGSITNSTSDFNQGTGISITGGSVTSCTANFNGDDGINIGGVVLAFCSAELNNRNNNGGLDIRAAYSNTRTGNRPTP